MAHDQQQAPTAALKSMQKFKRTLVGLLHRNDSPQDNSVAANPPIRSPPNPMVQHSVLFSLPVDLLVEHVLSRLEPRSLAIYRIICRVFDDIIKNSVQLSYSIELHKEGMADNPRCPYDLYPLSLRLKMLQECSTRWKQLRARWSCGISLPTSCSGRPFSLTLSSCQDLLILPTQVDEGSDPPVFIAYISRLPDTPTATLPWDEIILDEHILDVEMAVEEHDLLVCVTSVPSSNPPATSIRIHFRCRSTLLTHPSAVSPVLDIADFSATANGLHVHRVYISGPNLAVTIMYTSIESASQQFILYVLDWMTGVMKYEQHGQYLSGAVFLNQDFILTLNGSISSASLDILYIPPSSDKVLPIHSLVLPELVYGSRVAYLTCVTRSNPPVPPRCVSSQPFTIDPQSEVLIFKFGVLLGGLGGLESLMFVVKRFRLLELALDALANYSAEGMSQKTPTPWHAWGPHSTRWFSHDVAYEDRDSVMTWTDFSSSRGARGLAHFVTTNVQNRTECLNVRLLQFGVPALVQSPGVASRGSTLLTKIFREPINSYLPCDGLEELDLTSVARDSDRIPLNGVAKLSRDVVLSDECIFFIRKDNTSFEVLNFG